MSDLFKIIEQTDGPTLGYSKVAILEVDGLMFKDFNQNGVLDPYEDWRLSTQERANDLVKRMSIEQIGGLMLYSKHQTVSTGDDLFSKMFAGTYDGLPFEQSSAAITDLSDEQKAFLKDDHLRHVLVTTVNDAYTSARWSNNIQSFVEGIGLGIPANNSSDPRHAPSAHTEFNAGSGGDISKWPEPLGLAATFNPDRVHRFGEVAAREYRALGITTALSPQIDIATDPRWMRFNGTFGEDTLLATDLARAYIDGFQSDAWGRSSVNAMVKHWPGGGSGEGGRDAHYGFGKYAVYPGKNFEEHKLPFTQGAFKLKGGTKSASAVMPYYTISYDQDLKYNENVGNSYSKFIIQDQLRDLVGYDGVVCTDWMITGDDGAIGSFMIGKCWGVEDLSIVERHFKIIMAGVDQFGGNNELQPVLDSYAMGVEQYGEVFMRLRFEMSAKRLLTNIFNTGLFENPYVNESLANDLVGQPDFMHEGYEMQKDSIVLLKNKGSVLPIEPNKKVYIPNRRIKEGVNWFGQAIPAGEVFPVDKGVINRFYTLVDSPSEADFALVFIESPQSVAYSKEDGYIPISLQYRPYISTLGRVESIAGDRSYFNKSNTTTNEYDLDIILETRAAMGDKPVIVSMNAISPSVVGEFEGHVDGLLVNFNVQVQAILDIVSGAHQPYGLLPYQMPKDMATVETQFEDVAHDMEVHVDADGNAYDFAFGLNFGGVIDDERVKKYRKVK